MTMLQPWAWIDAVRDLFAVKTIGVVYQPLVDPRTGVVVGHEALARFRDTRGSAIAPDRVFEALHGAGPGILFAAEVALKRFQIRCAPAEGLLFVNFDPCALAGLEAGRAQRVFDDLLTLRPRVVVELIENTHTAHVDLVERTTRDLHARGVPLALDDIGAPGTLLSLYQMSLAGFLKFDRHWLRHWGENRPLLDSLLAYARATRKRTVLEGVESEEQRQVARDSGFDLIQGFLFRERFLGFEGPLSALSQGPSCLHTMAVA